VGDRAACAPVAGSTGPTTKAVGVLYSAHSPVSGPDAASSAAAGLAAASSRASKSSIDVCVVRACVVHAALTDVVATQSTVGVESDPRPATLGMIRHLVYQGVALGRQGVSAV
jgi:hypothetical protein